MSQTSPFKFLDAYDKSDRAIYFGRDEEIETLYNMAYQSNLTLVYGRSGTGKTSLIQCGLANRFKTSDWLNIYVRRRNDINASLLDSLKKLKVARKRDTGSSLRQRLQKRNIGRSSDQNKEEDHEQAKSEVITALKDLYAQYFKPIYLIFDQFEELFILGDKHDEQPTFYQSISDILESCGFCHMIFILREEAIAELYDFEKVVPYLFEKRLRVEQLGRGKITDVIEQTTAKFDIALEDEHVADAIIDSISSGKGRVELTYLQVFLDAQYQEAIKENPNDIIFTNAQVDHLGGIDDVLANFLSVQSNRIQNELESGFSGVHKKSVSMVLNAFVSLEGTKQPMTIADLNIPKVSGDQIHYCLDQLEKARILRFDDDRYELAHDALAAKIAEDRSSADIAFLEVVKLVRDRHQAFGRTHTYLNNNELVLYKIYEQRIEDEAQLTSEQDKYVKNSQIQNAKKRRRRTITFAAVASVLLVAAIISGSMWYSVSASSYEKFLAVASMAEDNGEYEASIEAYQQAQGIYDADSLVGLIARSELYRQDKNEFDSVMTLANRNAELDTAFSYIQTCNRWIFAREMYTLALSDKYQINVGDRDEGEVKLKAHKVALYYRNQDLLRRADLMYDVDSEEAYAQALILYNISRKIESSSELTTRIKYCEEN